MVFGDHCVWQKKSKKWNAYNAQFSPSKGYPWPKNVQFGSNTVTMMGASNQSIWRLLQYSRRMCFVFKQTKRYRLISVLLFVCTQHIVLIQFDKELRKMCVPNDIWHYLVCYERNTQRILFPDRNIFVQKITVVDSVIGNSSLKNKQIENM